MNNKIVALALFAILVGCAMGTEESHSRHTQAARSHSTTTTSHSTTGSSSGSGSGGCVISTASEPLKVMVPLYVYPGSAWDEVIAAAASVKIMVIINPNSGPDPNGPDSTYTTYMRKLTAAGIDMVGYVHTSYGDRSSSDVNADIDTFASKYTGLKGIFLDEASALASEVSYYTTVYNHIISKSGYTNVILNPGVQPVEQYLAISTNIMVFEDTASNFGTFDSWVSCAPSGYQQAGYKYRFSSIAYGASTSKIPSLVTSMMNAGMGYVYLSERTDVCCIYNTLATIFNAEVTEVVTLN
jgi:hypothetical protein